MERRPRFPAVLRPPEGRGPGAVCWPASSPSCSLRSLSGEHSPQSHFPPLGRRSQGIVLLSSGEGTPSSAVGWPWPRGGRRGTRRGASREEVEPGTGWLHSSEPSRHLRDSSQRPVLSNRPSLPPVLRLGCGDGLYEWGRKTEQAQELPQFRAWLTEPLSVSGSHRGARRKPEMSSSVRVGNEHALEARHGREQSRMRPPLAATAPPAALRARPL